MSADVRELVQHAQALAGNERAAAQQMRAVVARGALNVKRDWQSNAVTTAGRHARRYPASISYDLTPLPGGATAEIGPDKARPQGALGNLLEFGSVHNPPHNDGGRALLTEEPRFAAQVAAVAARGMRL